MKFPDQLEELGRAEAESGSGEEAVSLQRIDPDLARMADLPIRVSVELDRKPAPVREILDYRPGAIIVLSRSAGENVDLLLNGLRVGGGEVVVIENLLGLRITDLRIDDVAASAG